MKSSTWWHDWLIHNWERRKSSGDLWFPFVLSYSSIRDQNLSPNYDWLVSGPQGLFFNNVPQFEILCDCHVSQENIFSINWVCKNEPIKNRIDKRWIFFLTFKIGSQCCTPFSRSKSSTRVEKQAQCLCLLIRIPQDFVRLSL